MSGVEMPELDKKDPPQYGNQNEQLIIFLSCPLLPSLDSLPPFLSSPSLKGC